MQPSLASVILSVLLACQANPAPRCKAPGHTTSDKYFGDASGDIVGAAYFLTDEPTGNFIVGSDIGSDGLLTLRRAVHAGGVGAHGLHDLGPDPLFSQGCIDLSAEKHVLVTVNPGSNTVAAFKIDPTDPTNLKMIGKPVDSHGDFPASVALNKAADRACIINSGTHDGVSCYSIDAKKGLYEIPNTVRPVGLNQTTPPTGTSGTLSNIIFSEDETKLYVAVKGTDPAINVDTHPGFFAVWDIQHDGSLSEKYTRIPVPEGGKQPFAMTPIPNENAILGADGAAGFYVWDLETIDQGVPGPRSSVTPVEGQSSVCWSRYSSCTGNFYVVDGVISNITQVTLDDDLKPTSVMNFPQGIFDATLDFDIMPVNDQDHMYILAANATALRVMQLAPNEINQLQSIDLAAPSATVGLTINPNNFQGLRVFMK
uniref:Lactonase n=1 Tax=Agaricus bisporus TaxID=5341 RepID=M1PVF0_AGABI|nr:lactonase [Agaricus bisporus]